MKYVLMIFLFQDFMTVWFGEMSVLEWLVLLLVSLLLSSIPLFIYKGFLRNHLKQNRDPSTLRLFSLSLWAVLCFLWCLLFFRGASSWLAFTILFIVSLLSSVAFFISGRKQFAG